MRWTTSPSSAWLTHTSASTSEIEGVARLLMLPLPALPAPDVVTRVAVVEGYNSNTYQAQDDPNIPLIERHPSPFTGLDGNLELRFLGRDSDRTTILLGGRLNHYEPLQQENQSDDGAFNGLLTTNLTLGKRTLLNLSESASVTSFNAAHVTDGTIFAFDPTRVRSTYWIEDFSASIGHQLSANWRLTQSIGATVSGTLSSSPTQLPSGPLVEHRGLDYVQPYIETDLSKDFSWRSAADLVLLYQYAYELFVLDFTQTPPKNIGPDKTAFATALAGYTYHFSPELSVVLHGGAVLASAPARDIDQRAILAPSTAGEVYYSRDFFTVVATGGYTFGTVNPRLGEGPTASASLFAVGFPYHVGQWKNLALLGTAQLSYSSLITGVGQSTKLGLYAAGIEVRYGLNNWLGLTGGYNVRAANFDTPGVFEPPFFQQIFFLGFSGYWSTDPTQIPLTNFAAPVQPPA